MKIRLKINLLLILLICLTNSLVGQKVESFSFNQDTESYTGNFQWSFPSNPHTQENGVYIFDLKNIEEGRVRLNFSKLNWTSHTNLPEGVFLRFKHSLLTSSSETFDLEYADNFSYNFSENETGNWVITYQLVINDQLLDSKNFTIPYKVIVKEEPVTTSPPPTEKTDKEPKITEETEKPIVESNEALDTPNPPPVANVETSADEDKWMNIENSKKITDFTQFIKDFPNSPFKQEAIKKKNALEEEERTRIAQDKKRREAARNKRKKAAKIIITDIQKDGNQYSIITDNTIAPIIKQLDGDGAGLEVSGIIKQKEFSHEIIIELLDAEKMELIIIDSAKTGNLEAKVPPLDNLLKGVMKITGDTLSFTFEGGQAPYSLIIDNEHFYPKKINAKSFIINTATFRDELNLKPGKYDIELLDNSQYYHFKFPEKITITAPPSTETDLLKKYLPGVLLGFALLLGAFIFSRNNRRKKRRAELLKAKAKTQPVSAKTSPKKQPIVKEKIVPKKETPNEAVVKVDLAPEIKEEISPITQNAETKEEIVKVDLMNTTDDNRPKKDLATTEMEQKEITASTPQMGVTPSRETISSEKKRNSSFKIKARKPNKNKLEAQQKWAQIEVRNEDIYYPLAMERHWKDSNIKSIHFAKESIFKLDSFLRTNNTSMLREEEDNIPEIGGMLLGTFRLDAETQQYQVTVEKFVAIQAKFQNNYRLEFDPNSLALDLVHIQDEFPDLSLVGWFHTHPGHGLFLSKPDLKIQNGFFREKYQFAMEIDSITENLDTGFFTRKKDGQMNNKEDRKKDSTWFAWTDIEKFTRHKA